MHFLITDDPEWQALQQVRRQITRLAEVHRRQVEAEQAEYRRLVAEHAVAKEEALLAGEPPPTPPATPVTDPADAGIFIARLSQCSVDERVWLGHAAPRLEQRLTDRETQLLADAAEAVAALRAIATEMNELCQSAKAVRAAAGDQRPVHRRTIHSQDLCVAVEQRGRFLSALLPTGDVLTRGSRPTDDSEHVATFEAVRRRVPPPAPQRSRR